MENVHAPHCTLLIQLPGQHHEHSMLAPETKCMTLVFVQKSRSLVRRWSVCVLSCIGKAPMLCNAVVNENSMSHCVRHCVQPSFAEFRDFPVAKKHWLLPAESRKMSPDAAMARLSPHVMRATYVQSKPDATPSRTASGTPHHAAPLQPYMTPTNRPAAAHPTPLSRSQSFAAGQGEVSNGNIVWSPVCALFASAVL